MAALPPAKSRPSAGPGIGPAAPTSSSIPAVSSSISPTSAPDFSVRCPLCPNLPPTGLAGFFAHIHSFHLERDLYCSYPGCSFLSNGEEGLQELSKHWEEKHGSSGPANLDLQAAAFWSGLLNEAVALPAPASASAGRGSSAEGGAGGDSQDATSSRASTCQLSAGLLAGLAAARLTGMQAVHWHDDFVALHPLLLVGSIAEVRQWVLRTLAPSLPAQQRAEEGDRGLLAATAATAGTASHSESESERERERESESAVAVVAGLALQSSSAKAAVKGTFSASVNAAASSSHSEMAGRAAVTAVSAAAATPLLQQQQLPSQQQQWQQQTELCFVRTSAGSGAAFVGEAAFPEQSPAAHTATQEDADLSLHSTAASPAAASARAGGAGSIVAAAGGVGRAEEASEQLQPPSSFASASAVASGASPSSSSASFAPVALLPLAAPNAAFPETLAPTPAAAAAVATKHIISPILQLYHAVSLPAEAAAAERQQEGKGRRRDRMKMSSVMQTPASSNIRRGFAEAETVEETVVHAEGEERCSGSKSKSCTSSTLTSSSPYLVSAFMNDSFASHVAKQLAFNSSFISSSSSIKSLAFEQHAMQEEEEEAGAGDGDAMPAVSHSAARAFGLSDQTSEWRVFSSDEDDGDDDDGDASSSDDGGSSIIMETEMQGLRAQSQAEKQRKEHYECILAGCSVVCQGEQAFMEHVLAAHTAAEEDAHLSLHSTAVGTATGSAGAGGAGSVVTAAGGGGGAEEGLRRTRGATQAQLQAGRKQFHSSVPPPLDASSAGFLETLSPTAAVAAAIAAKRMSSLFSQLVREGIKKGTGACPVPGCLRQFHLPLATDQLKDHFRHKHVQVSFYCSACGNSFTTAKLRESHWKEAHTGPCPLGRRFCFYRDPSGTELLLMQLLGAAAALSALSASASSAVSLPAEALASVGQQKKRKGKGTSKEGMKPSSEMQTPVSSNMSRGSAGGGIEGETEADAGEGVRSMSSKGKSYASSSSSSSLLPSSVTASLSGQKRERKKTRASSSSSSACGYLGANSISSTPQMSMGAGKAQRQDKKQRQEKQMHDTISSAGLSLHSTAGSPAAASAGAGGVGSVGAAGRGAGTKGRHRETADDKA